MLYILIIITLFWSTVGCAIASALGKVAWGVTITLFVMTTASIVGFIWLIMRTAFGHQIGCEEYDQELDDNDNDDELDLHSYEEYVSEFEPENSEYL